MASVCHAASPVSVHFNCCPGHVHPSRFLMASQWQKHDAILGSISSKIPKISDGWQCVNQCITKVPYFFCSYLFPINEDDNVTWLSKQIKPNIKKSHHDLLRCMHYCCGNFFGSHKKFSFSCILEKKSVEGKFCHHYVHY